jgi:hypothetical protein
MIGFRSPAETEDFFSLASVSRPAQAYPASSPMGIGGPFPGVKRGRDADHSPLSSAEVKNE